MPDDTITAIIDSLEQRGFIVHSYDAIKTQVLAVAEELGELSGTIGPGYDRQFFRVSTALGQVARTLRRIDQGRAVLDPDELMDEAADVVIAAICLMATVSTRTLRGAVMDEAGINHIHETLLRKARADESRGRLHAGKGTDDD